MLCLDSDFLGYFCMILGVIILVLFMSWKNKELEKMMIDIDDRMTLRNYGLNYDSKVQIGIMILIMTLLVLGIVIVFCI